MVAHCCNPSKPRQKLEDYLRFKANLIYMGSGFPDQPVKLFFLKTMSFLIGNFQHKPVVPGLERWRREDHEFNTILSYIASLRPDWAI